MKEKVGVVAAILSCTFGGMAAAVTRYAVDKLDPPAIASFRFGIGFALLLPLALALSTRWPRGRDFVNAALLGVAFFAGFFLLYNLAFEYTTAARGALALSTLPLMTMVVAACFGAEQLTMRKTLGVLIAIGGVTTALAAGLTTAPEGALRGDLIMLCATIWMAFYNVWSGPLIARSEPLSYLTVGMGCGAVVVIAISIFGHGFDPAWNFGTPEWLAVFYLGVFGGAAGFYLWVFALERASPTRVANTMTVNPLAASILAAVLIQEPIGLNLVVGLVAVAIGIWLASTDGPKPIEITT